MFVRNRLVSYIKTIETLVSPARNLPADKANVITGGYGETDTKRVHAGMIVTEALATAWLNSDLDAIEASVVHMVPFRLTDGQGIALIDFCYNEGCHALLESSLMKRLLAKDFHGAALEFQKWDMANGKHLAGLKKRRFIEFNWFEKTT